MKQAGDDFTHDLLGNNKRGRPRKPDALTPAERARAYRARKREFSDSLEGLKQAFRPPRPTFHQAIFACDELIQAAGLSRAEAQRVIDVLWPGIWTE